MTNYCPIPGASQPKLQTCSGCKYWKTLIGVCTNIHSPRCTNFVYDGCDKKEKNNATD